MQLFLLEQNDFTPEHKPDYPTATFGTAEASIAIYHFKKMNVRTALGATIRIGRKCTREEIHKGWPGSQLTT